MLGFEHAKPAAQIEIARSPVAALGHYFDIAGIRVAEIALRRGYQLYAQAASSRVFGDALNGLREPLTRM